MQQSRLITRKSASNLALAFVLLPRSKREAMAALYAFCREVDDIADDEGRPVVPRREELAAWRADVRQACDGADPEFEVNRELQPFIRQYRLPFALFDELLQGVEMDLDVSRYPDWPQLELYCYRVASVVGLLSIEIFGYQSAVCRDYAVHLGKALQLTNILRDVRGDAQRGRIYLPQTELARFQVSEAEILRFEYSERFAALAETVARRAREYYRLARETLPRGERRAMIAAELMGAVYWRLLGKLEQHRFNVLGPQPMKLSKPLKCRLVAQTWFKVAFGAPAPVYGPR